MNYLIVGYGNTLRSDDGAGQIVANQIATWQLPNVRSLSVHQLTPELAEPIANAHTIIFVDAIILSAINSKTVEIQEIEADNKYLNSGHTINPRSLLYLAKTLYNKFPKAYWILIPAINFEFGEELSSLTQTGITQSLEKIQQLLGFTNCQTSISKKLIIND